MSPYVQERPSLMPFVSVRWAAVTMVLASCSADLAIQREGQTAAEDMPAVQYSIVFVLHGDGDYLYHDTGGNEYRADEEALAGAQRVALRNPHAEVFIFHQRSRTHFLFFPLRDGEFYYYRNGLLIAHESYWRDKGQSHPNPEVGLYHRYRAQNQPGMVNVFLYAGHEIPEFGGAGYDESYPDHPFTVHDFAAGLRDFTPDSSRFNLLVLSTCFGGTPYTIGALGPAAHYIIASPDNLHLSYFDLSLLERLDLNFLDHDVPAFAEKFARQAFDRLTNDIQTAVSVAVYDVDRVQEFLRSVHTMYGHTLTTLNEETHATRTMIGRCDCADLPQYVLPTMNDGVDVFYRPARFGRSKLKTNHSGWECWGEQGAATSQTIEPVPE